MNHITINTLAADVKITKFIKDGKSYFDTEVMFTDDRGRRDYLNIYTSNNFLLDAKDDIKNVKIVKE